MLDSDLILNLICIEKGIIQLSDVESAEKQFQSLSQADKRTASRKIKKLAKKYISTFVSGERQIHAALRAAGFVDAKPGFKNRKRYEKTRIKFARQYLRFWIVSKMDY